MPQPSQASDTAWAGRRSYPGWELRSVCPGLTGPSQCNDPSEKCLAVETPKRSLTFKAAHDVEEDLDVDDWHRSDVADDVDIRSGCHRERVFGRT